MWWFLFHEFETPGRLETYEERHAIRYAREGYALPDLLIKPEGETVRLHWARCRLSRQPIEFVAEGTEHVSAAAMRTTLSEFIESVLKRLDEAGLSQTFLAQEWQSVTEAEADPETAAFCVAAARLGIDPFCVDAMQREKIFNAGAILTDDALLDFLSVADLTTIDRDLAWINAGLKDVREAPPEFGPLRALRNRISLPRASSPWDEGYALARTLRETLGLNGHIFRSEYDLYSVFSRTSTTPSQAVLYRGRENHHISAVCAETGDRAPGFILTAKPDTASRRFLLCRAVHDYMRDAGASVSLITDTRSDRQKRNRAFAAEFLAPAHLLQRRIDRPVVGGDQVEELAEEFGVSERVIEHQIQNHRLARLIPD